MAPLALLALLALPAPAERHSPQRLSAPIAQAQAPAPTHRIPVRVVILQGSRWSSDVVAARVEKTKEILAQCGVKLETSLVTLSPPSGQAGVIYETTRSNEPGGMSTIVRALAQPKPTLFYVETFVDNGSQGGTSRTRQSVPAGEDVPEMDTAWVPYFETPPPDHVNYLVDAHELVHVLADMKHWSPPYEAPPGRTKEDPPDPNKPDPGLMTKMPYVRTNVLHQPVCDKIKRHPAAKPL